MTKPHLFLGTSEFLPGVVSFLSVVLIWQVTERGVSALRVRLDDVELALSEDVLEKGKRAVFEVARQDALGRNAVIVGIMVDGEPINDEETFYSLSGGLDIHFTSQPVRDLVAESLGEGERYLPLLSTGLETVATLFEEKKNDEAQSKLLQAIEGINWLVDVFDKSCVLMGIRPDVLKSGNFLQDRATLNDVLSEMVDVMESEKMIDLAYLIREKLLPVVNKFSVYWAEISTEMESPLQ